MEYTLTQALGVLFLAFSLCAFCSASETGLFSLNRYRLRHRASYDKRAKRLNQLLNQPDKVLGAILIGNVFTTAIASTVSHYLGLRYFGEIGALASPFVLTILLLVFAEVTPKTLAALKPEATAYASAWPLQILIWLLYPVVWVVSKLSLFLIRCLGVHQTHKAQDSLNIEELKTIVNEANVLISTYHQDMLMGILNLDKIRVEHIMIPRNEVLGLNLDEPDQMKQVLAEASYTFLPLYRSDLDNILGILHTRNLSKALASPVLPQEGELLRLAQEPYFVPEGTSLYQLLLNFQRDKARFGLVVDEYGDVLGLVTLDDIISEIVGDFSQGTSHTTPVVQAEDGTFLVDGSIAIRELNKLQNWHFPTEGPNTLSGLITETLEAIPSPKTCLKIGVYTLEILQMKDNTVKSVKIRPLN